MTTITATLSIIILILDWVTTRSAKAVKALNSQAQGAD